MQDTKVQKMLNWAHQVQPLRGLDFRSCAGPHLHSGPSARRYRFFGIQMNIFKLFLFSFLLSACSYDVSFTIQDEKEAGELASDIVRKLATRTDIEQIYENSHEEFRKTSWEDYLAFVEMLSLFFDNSTIILDGYETYNTEDSIAVYGVSTKDEQKIYFRVSFWGDKTQGYKLYGLHGSDKPYPYNGEYSTYEEPIRVQI